MSITAVYCDGGCTRCTWGLVLAKEYCCGVLEVILIVLQSCPRMSWCFGPVLLYFVLYAARYLYVYMTQCRILGKLRYTWGPNFKVVLLMILVCQVHYYNIGSTLHKYECREMDIWLDICDIWFYKKGPLKSSKMLQLAWNFFWLDKIKIYCHLSFTNFSVRQVLNWFFLRYLPYWYLQGSCCKIVNINQICVKFVLRGNYKILLTPLLL